MGVACDTLSFVEKKMSEFSVAVAYALSCLRQEHIVLKDKQLEVLQELYRGNDVFSWFPTGYGKSVCYQLLPFLFDHKLKRTTSPALEQSVVLVISPLVLLMVDQVSSLQHRHVAAGILSGNKGVDKKYLASAKDISEGYFRLLYSSPEAILGSEQWKDLLLLPPLSGSVVAVAVDEAHCVYKWSSDFRPLYSHLHELRAFVPSGVPMLAATATVTDEIRRDVIQQLDMDGCKIISVSPNKPNIFYSVCKRSTIEDDFSSILDDLSLNAVRAKRVIVYCRSLNMCSALYAHFHYNLGDKSYYPPGAERKSDNRLFGMYHSKTDEHNKEVIMTSMSKQDGVVRVVFATMALGMGVNFSGLTCTIHYGAPCSLDDYFQESGRAGRGGEQSTSTIYWAPLDVPVRQDLSDPRNAEVAVVRRYLENKVDCRRYLLLHYFDPALASTLERRDKRLCCETCKAVVDKS